MADLAEISLVQLSLFHLIAFADLFELLDMARQASDPPSVHMIFMAEIYGGRFLWFEFQVSSTRGGISRCR